MTAENHIAIDNIIRECGSDKKNVIPLLQGLQDHFHYLPADVLKEVCRRTGITPAQVMGVASFYSQFRFQPTGKHIIKVCTGTACHVKRSGLVYDAFTRSLQLEPGNQTDPKGIYTLDKVNCLGCCTLAPVVQIEDTTYGHVDVEGVNRILKSFELKQSNSKQKSSILNNTRKIQGEIRVGLGSCCVASGSEAVRDSIHSAVIEKDLNVRMKRVGCVGMCHQVPLVEVIPKGKEPTLYSKVRTEDVSLIINKHFRPQGLWQKLSSSVYDLMTDIQTDKNWDGISQHHLQIREKHVTSFLGKQKPITTEFRGAIDPLDIDEYRHHHGFKALESVLSSISQQDIINKVKGSGLRGRGGAGYPTWEKWEKLKNQTNATKYIICNGDEGDPGAFMDRMLLESYPYRIIEGMIIAAYATQVKKGYFYIRAEYQLAVNRIKEALRICREQDYLGENILGSGLCFDIEIFEGAGAFICGEETALIASIEGNRGFPRLRPPYPVEKGLWGYPTLVNNVETFATIPYIIRDEGDNYNKLGTPNSKGTKVFSLAGKINRGGLIEVPMGITIREIIEDIGGGVADDKNLKAVQIGGPSGGCVPSWLIDTPIDYQSLKEIGAIMGSGGLLVLDETDCMVDIARFFLSFTQMESCGKCTFCRIGTKRMLDILNSICSGQGTFRALEELERLAQSITNGSLCGLGQTAPNPVLSTIRYFRDEYEAHIRGVCPSGKCQDLITYTINDNCIGCTKCAQNCPVDAIPFVPYEIHTIDQELCIKCDGCKQICPEDAVLVS